jgi:hypothetical protein
VGTRHACGVNGSERGDASDRLAQLSRRMRRSSKRVSVYGLIILAISLVAALTGNNHAPLWALGGLVTAMGPLMLMGSRWVGQQVG